MMATRMGNEHTDIVIVGAGSVGLTLANLLGRYGANTVVIERDAMRQDAPRAVGIDDESLRVWQAAGLLEKILPHVAFGNERDVVLAYLTSRHRPFFEIRQVGRPLGFPRGATFVQQPVDEELERGLGRFENIRLLRGWNVEAISQDEGGASVRAAGNGASATLRCDYVVACDGAHSPTRERLGIAMRGFTYPNRWLVVDGAEPREHPEKITRGVEVWSDSARPAASVPLPHGLRRWEFLLRADEADAVALETDFIYRLLAMRGGGPQVRILRRAVYRFSTRVADCYRTGRVFLAGDAAHVTPPFAAQGLVSGLRDVFNLAWKLAAVSRGGAQARLLDTYEMERRPHQKQMLRLAVNLGRLMMPKHRLQELVVAGVIGTVTRVSAVREAMAMRGSGLQARYQRGFVASGIGRGGLAGRHLPQPKVRLAGGREILFDELLGESFAVVGIGVAPEAVLSPDSLSWLRSLRARLVHVTHGTPERPNEVQDLNGLFVPVCRRDKARFLIVRPDRFVFAAGAFAQADRLVAHLREQLGE